MEPIDLSMVMAKMEERFNNAQIAELVNDDAVQLAENGGSGGNGDDDAGNEDEDNPYQHHDYMGLAEELNSQLQIIVGAIALPEGQAPPEIEQIASSSDVLTTVLRDKKAQEAMMAEDLTMIAMALTGQSRADLQEGYDDDSGMEDQTSVGEWVKATFDVFAGKKNLAFGCVEEAMKLAFASGCTAAELGEVFRVVIQQESAESTHPPGQLAEELGDLQLMVWAYGASVEIPADLQAEMKMMFNRSRDKEFYLERIKAKVLMGMPFEHTPIVTEEPKDT